ncbi:hypothetical protein MNBD_GAMMA11-1030 [hydrothermal vent metagenome]|uniref:Serine aminopeptidase S33 domain-containing protein n=1 Tax=hydrothermal vent metagenome TaxID=652676 RepID=A0A3B0WQA8_9ZZZZ
MVTDTSSLIFTCKSEWSNNVYIYILKHFSGRYDTNFSVPVCVLNQAFQRYVRVTVLRKYLIVLPVMLLFSACTGLFFQPLKQHFASPEDYGLEYEDIYFKGRSGLKLHGWWFAGRPSSKGSVLFLHGNGQNISTHAGLIHWLTRYQYDVFIFDYRGYGKSEGEANIEGILEDIQSARNYLAERADVKKMFVVGHSLGASLAISNLAQYPDGPDGAIFVSPFGNYRKIAREVMSRSWLTWALQWPVSLGVTDNYNPEDVVDQLPPVPVLFIYSEQDQMINPRHVLDLYALATGPGDRSIVGVKGRHNQIFAEKETRKAIVRYLDQWSEE